MIKNSERPYIVAVDDVTGSRELSTVYTNTTGKTLIVCVTGSFVTTINTQSAQMAAFTNAGLVSTAGIADGTIARLKIPFTFFVPPSTTYAVTRTIVGGGNAAIFKWIEAY